MAVRGRRILSAAWASRVAKHVLQRAQGPRKGHKNIQVPKLSSSLSGREHVLIGFGACVMPSMGRCSARLATNPHLSGTHTLSILYLHVAGA